ncbi:MAG: TonB-dependent receptor, partial [Bacteroidota bacterium]
FLMKQHALKTCFIVVFLTCIHSAGWAQQNTASLSGHVINKEEGEAELGCIIVLVELNMWAMTDQNGYYKINKIPVGGTYTIKTSSLCLETFETKINFNENKEYKLDISLARMSFEMEEVVVLAEEKKGLGSTSTISQEAMEHLQPASLKDIMQLLPGQLSTNPNLSGKAQISIRDIGTDANSSLGTAIIVDGSPVTNNADMQTKSTSISAVEGGGVDVRQIATNNIESIEVIRGIASVEYGDMTSGAVIVKTKAGETPLKAKVSINPRIKRAYLGKGYRLKRTAAAVNFDVEYTSSIDSKITPYEGFERLSAQLGYSKTFMKSTAPLTFNLKAKYFQTIDSEKSDPDFISQNEEYTSSDQGVNFGIHGKWNLKKKLITNLDYSFSSSANIQELYNREVISLGYIQPISNARKDTLMPGEYAPSEYYSEMTVDGRPFNIYGKLTANKIFHHGDILNNLIYGMDYRSSGNNGRGRMYDEMRPPRLGGGNATRPRPYNEVPGLSQFALFISDNLTLPLGKTTFFLEAGLRFNNYQPVSLFEGEIETFTEPRINIKYEFLNENNNKLFDELAVFGGYGIHSKSPTIVHLYPDLAYYDLNSFNYFASNPSERLLLVSTRVRETSNPNLSPIRNDKYEAGLEGEIRDVNFRINAYYENQNDGLDFANQAIFLEFYKWNLEDPNIQFPEGMPPVIALQNPSEIDTFIASYNKPQNTRTLIKKGIEYVVNLGEIKPIKTDLNITGAYLFTKSFSNSETQTLPYGDGATQLDWVGVYPAGTGSERIRFNTNLIAVTHIPKLRLIFSTTLQLIWKNSYRYFLGGGQPWDYASSTGTYIVKAPIALIDKSGVRREISKEEVLTEKYDYYLSKYKDYYFDPENQPIHYMLNMKVTSEIGTAAKFSFFANNFTMHNPRYKSKRTNSILTLNSPLYFGLELTFLF